ncbi:MAG TPA: DNRLRE domain-containing protein, partial [Deltaproteobacteria bacterium]|nr:DNRLRE domain-containing protein [Deltaproteobacteria bacterium]
MKQIILLAFVCFGFNLSALPAAHAVQGTLVLQQGLEGYAGVKDTWISANDWESPPQDTRNYGQNNILLLERNGGNNPLLRFDLGSIPVNSKVVSAVLSLYNRTHSGSGGQDYVRRVRLYGVLVDWDEGNQVDSPINVIGAHGATGYNAFEYYSGEGTNVPWGERGMAAGQDYAENHESYADVANEGWYTWDVADLARAWIRGEQSNFGVVLRDATGYQEGDRDDREFVSSQETDAALRPKLTIIYNPDVPFANAGPDRETFQWDGGAVALDGSGSHDRPGGNDATLTYSWRIVQTAYGSGMSGALPGTTALTNFTPDKAGEWEIELTVTNELGETATDTVYLRLLSIPFSHPRIYLTPAKLTALKAHALPSNPRWVQLKEEADQTNGSMQAKALAWQITGNTAYCSQAVALALEEIADPNEWSTKAGDIAVVFDWCHDCLSTQQIAQFVSYFNAWGDDIPKGEDVPGWGNYWPRYSYSYSIIGLASYGDNSRAGEWLDEYRHTRYRDNDLLLLEHIAKGGAWPEGMVYDWIANWPRVKAVEAWRTATGEDLFESTGWFQDRLGYLLLHHWPGQAEQWGESYRPYLSTGDGERNRGTMANYERIMALILVGRYSDDPLASQLQAYLAAPPANSSMDFVCHEEFLWFDPNWGSGTPQLLTHYASGTGTLFMRSDWPDGAA